jgi:hypothetical protein
VSSSHGIAVLEAMAVAAEVRRLCGGMKHVTPPASASRDAEALAEKS